MKRFSCSMERLRTVLRGPFQKKRKTRGGRKENISLYGFCTGAAVMAVGLILSFSDSALLSQSGGTIPGAVEGRLTIGAQGSAVYRIPIKVAPGTQNLHPELAFLYNSSSTSNGIMGVGWNLYGLSAISRCGKKKYLDGAPGPVTYSDSDRLCKDGVRMMPHYNTTNDAHYWDNYYHTETEDWSKTYASGACGRDACSYTSHQKDGRTLTYGGHSSSRIEGNGERVKMWLLSQVKDKNGNVMNITYHERNRSAQPATITYGNRSVHFIYQYRSNVRDRISGYQAGQKYAINDRLSRVDLKVNGSVFKKYYVGYRTSGASGRSQVNRIQECDSAGKCLEPTVVNWNDRTENGTFRVVTPSGGIYQSELRADHGANIIPGDFNGDGKTDFIRQEKGGWDNDTSNSFNVYFSNGNGYFNRVTPSGNMYQSELRFDHGANIITGDYNGDGKMDFIRQEKGGWDDDTSNSFNVYFSRGNGYFDRVTPGGHQYQDWLRNDPGVNIIPGDFNGDGKTDFIRQEKGGWDGDTSNSFNVYLSRGNGYFDIITPGGDKYQHWLRFDPGANIITGDYNGDGKTDFIRQEKGGFDDDTNVSFSVYFSRGNGHFDIVTPGGGQYQDQLRFDPGVNIIPGDFNGDGLTDFLRQEKGGWDGDTTNSFNVYFSKGNGYFDVVTPGGDVYQSWLRADPGAIIIPGDFNGDGKSDFIRQEKGDFDNDTNVSFSIYMSRGDGHFDIKTPGGGVYQDWLRFDPGANIIPGDYDGDGLLDFIRQEKGNWDNDENNSFNVYFNKRSTGEKRADMVSSIQEGNGLKHEFAYKSMANGAYPYSSTPGSGYREYRGAMHLVTGYTKRDLKTGQKFRLNYSYRKAVMSKNGHGFMGFGQVIADSIEEGKKRYMDYRTDFPYNGKMSRMRVYNRSNNSILKDERYSWSRVNGSHNTTHQVNMLEKNSYKYYSGGNLHKKTLNRYDAFGNPYFMADYDYGQTNPVYTCASFSNDRNSWKLGLMNNFQVRASCSDQGKGNCSCSGAILKQKQYVYDSNRNLKERKTWDSSINGWLIEQFEYNAQGNKTRIRNHNGMVQTISYETVFDTFPSAITEDANGKKHRSSFEYDGKYGVQTRNQDPNGIVVRQSVDSLGRLNQIKVRSPAGQEYTRETRRYYRSGNYMVTESTQAQNWNGAVRKMRKFTDNMGRLVREEFDGPDGKTIVKLTDWNAQGLIARESQAFFSGQSPRWSGYAYDMHGKRTVLYHHNGTLTATSFTANGGSCGSNRLQERYVTAGERVRIHCRNGRNQLVREVHEHNNGTLTRNYNLDRVGNLLSVSDGNGISSSFEYDSLGRKTSATSTHKGREEYSYSALGKLAAIHHAGSNETTAFSHDGMGRITQTLHPDGSKTLYGYDDTAFTFAKGRMTSTEQINKSGGLVALREFGYGRQGKVTNMTLTMPEGSWNLRYSYLPSGDLKTMTFPDGSVVNRDYDQAGFLKRVSMDGTAYANYSGFSPVGQPANVSYANGSQGILEYDAVQRLARVRTIGKNTSNGNVTLQDQNYQWTAFNEVSRITDNRTASHTRTFSYNQLGYLTRAVGIYGTLDYEYNAAGNMTHKEGVNFTYNGSAPVSASNGLTLGYNSYGNRVSKSKGGSSWTYAYNGRKKLAEVKKNGKSVGKFLYDGNDRRVKKVDADGSVSIYVTPQYEITKLANGREMHTRYVDGVSGRVAAVTTAVNSNTSLFQHTQHMLRSGIYNTASLSGMAGFMNNNIMLFSSHPTGLGVLALKYPLMLAVALALLALTLWIFARSADGRTITGRARAFAAFKLEELGMLSLEKAEAWAAAAGTDFVKEHRKMAPAIPTMIFALMAFMVMNCQGDNPAGMQQALNGFFGTQTLSNGLVFAELNQDLVAGENGAGYPVVGSYFFHHDHVGSTSLLTDAQGKEVSRAVYKPYGEIYHPASPGYDLFRAKFTGKEFDKDAELYFFNARFYDASIGRFIQADNQVLGSSGRLPSDLNRYAYAANNPVLYTDPSGNFIFTLTALLIAVAIGATVGAAVYTGVALANGTWSVKGFFIAMGIGAAVGLLGYLTGAGGYALLTSYVFTSGTATAAVAAGAVSGLVSGAITGFTGGVLNQLAEYGEVRDWAQVGIETGIGAGLGMVMGAWSGFTEYHGALRRGYVNANRQLAANADDVARSGGSWEQVARANHGGRIANKTGALARTKQPFKSIAKYYTRRAYGNSEGAGFEFLMARQAAKGVTGDAAYRHIAYSATRTNVWWTRVANERMWDFAVRSISSNQINRYRLPD